MNNYTNDETFIKAKELYTNKEYNQSIELFTNIINKYPDNHVINNYLYVSYYNINNYQSSLYYIEQLMKTDDTPILYINYCKICLKLKLFEKTKYAVLKLVTNNENINNIEVHKIIYELGLLDPNVNQYSDICKNSLLTIINNDSIVNIKLYILLAKLFLYDDKIDDTWNIIHAIITKLVQLDQFKSYHNTISEHNVTDPEYKYVIMKILFNMDTNFFLKLLLYYDSNTSDLKQNLLIIQNELSYSDISSVISDLSECINLIFKYKYINNELSSIISKFLYTICPIIQNDYKIKTTNADNDNNITHKIAFIANSIRPFLYTHEKIIQKLIKEEKYDVFIYTLEQNIDDIKDIFNCNHIILCDDTIESYINIIQNGKIDTIIYLDIYSDIQLFVLSMTNISVNQYCLIDNKYIYNFHENKTNINNNTPNNWIGGIYNPINIELLKHNQINDFDTLFNSSSNIYIITETLKSFTLPFINSFCKILEKDVYGMLILRIEMVEYNKLLKIISNIPEINKTILLRIHFYPPKDYVNDCYLISNSTIYLDTFTNNSSILNYLTALYYDIPIITFSRNNILENMYQYINFTDLIVTSYEDFVSITMRIINDNKYRTHIKQTISENKLSLFNNDNQFDIYVDSILSIKEKDNVVTLYENYSENYSEIEKLLFS